MMTLVSETRDAVQQPIAQLLRPVAPPQTGAATSTRAWPVRVRRLAWGSIAVVGFFALWEFGPTFADPTSRVFLPPLHEVIQAGIKLTLNGQLTTHIGASLFRAAIGFVIAVALGVSAGLLISWYRPLRELLNPLLELFRNTAALALLPVLTLLLGIGEESKITIVVYAAFFPVLLNTVAGVRTVDPLFLTAARSLNIRGVDLFRKVILPSAVPTIFTGIRMAGTSSILVLIAAEMVGAKAGLGYLIINAQSSFLIPDMYAGILVVALLGLLTNTLLIALERRFSRWRSAVGNKLV
ncbi:ABC transporter permease protein [Renibacterium salmoninarum ATCC 33209]|uniref:ABC transporter permease protein n=2 Tax=Renibacterium salmoninarum TaxID=1646 RepID=A9WRL9_RENSM|nr:ABC transporter permease protein [Renibacterium salmoninarum ATCC 33209]